MTKPEIKNVGVVVKPDHTEAWETARQISIWLDERGIRVFTEKANGGGAAIEAIDAQEFKEQADLIIVLGGDGTMISSARLVGKSETPVLGINYGSLGYLTEFRIEEMYAALEAVLQGSYKLDARVMLDVELFRNAEKIAAARVLNEVVINRAVLAKIIEVEIFLDDLYVNSFRADGIIVATPTGSTAYSLSAGGPIVYPSMNAMAITPICPFTLTNRPLVIPDSAEIKLKLKSKSEGVALTFDGQISENMQTDDVAAIRKSRTSFNLIQPPNRNYFDVLRNKLKWGG